MRRLLFLSATLLFLFGSSAGATDPPLVPVDVARIGVEIEGSLWGFFDEVTQIGSRNEIVTQVVVDPDTGEIHIEKLPGRLEIYDVSLQRELSPDLDGWDWRQEVIDGPIDQARQNISLIFYDASNAEVGRFDMENCWPSEIESFAPTADGVAIERIVLACETLTRPAK